jgi:aldose sugar dehydrogenase
MNKRAAAQIFGPTVTMLPLVILLCAGVAEQGMIRRRAMPDDVALDTIATGLTVPWALAFAPDGRIFVTERPGRIRVIQNGVLSPTPWATLPVEASGEAGLMGIALAPDFATSKQLFVVGAFRVGSDLVNRVMRFTEREGVGADPTVILDRIPSNTLHAGDAIAFGPDSLLYIATGDARGVTRAQTGSLAGKILRIARDGSIPADNPDPSSPIWAKGFRNVQGLAWDPRTRQLFATEHGPSGFPNEMLRRNNDELNAVVRDGNFGWPVVAGTAPGPFVDPIAVWTPAIAPSGLALYDGTEFPEWRGNLFAGALRGEHLRRIAIAQDAAGAWRVTDQQPLFEGLLGRVRAVAFAPDGHLYLSVTNRDGRGYTRPGDDKILRVVRKRRSNGSDAGTAFVH